uniref:Uncharacterized protein n=1 Tax=Plectus sambesii TaxID=2011161 RepID=A0A914X0A5_9BILA
MPYDAIRFRQCRLPRHSKRRRKHLSSRPLIIRAYRSALRHNQTSFYPDLAASRCVAVVRAVIVQRKRPLALEPQQDETPSAWRTAHLSNIIDS